MTVLKWIAIILAAGYLAGLALLYFKQREMLFPIPPVGRTAPDVAGLAEAEEHVLTTSDGEKVIVWHVPAKPGRPVILFFHGNGDFLAGRVSRFKGMTADGTGLVALSFRGYAGSSGSPSEEGLMRDAAAAYAFTTARYAAERIVVWGFSLGTGVAVALASEQPVRKLILEAPYTSTVDVAASMFPIVPVRLLMRDPFRSDQRISRVTVPLLIMHGTDDPAIPIVFGERLFALAHEPKQFVRFPGGGHENLDGFGAIETARRFINGN
ncbi:alpha/beta hydrolase [Bradyrhizobium manausense]|uniref:alpha/beta hydrolase n=1 Tax=Bradyrhizobium TaxID=374 RepID=UPI001BADF692|nr:MULTISPECIES: alpha/beta hydrolase [Bradyrhizobium]MBR0825199.1 alpha/beta hydrolase [Bradyrhizobium manausense]UVO28387.1 alpha/beta hydrolase [Bradyrhizobium arachidis]